MALTASRKTKINDCQLKRKLLRSRQDVKATESYEEHCQESRLVCFESSVGSCCSRTCHRTRWEISCVHFRNPPPFTHPAVLFPSFSSPTLLFLLCGPSIHFFSPHAGPQLDSKHTCFPLKTFPEAVVQGTRAGAGVITHSEHTKGCSSCTQTQLLLFLFP